MNRIYEFNPCPICGKRDRMNLTQERDFISLKNRHGVKVVRVCCNRCDIDIFQNGRDASERYHIMVGELKKKWNCLGR